MIDPPNINAACTTLNSTTCRGREDCRGHCTAASQWCQQTVVFSWAAQGAGGTSSVAEVSSPAG